MKIKWNEPYGFWYTKKVLDDVHTAYRQCKGVYIIWVHNGPVVYVGSGDIDRLWDHLDESWIPNYQNLVANYAIINGNDPDIWRGIERYLAEELSPKEGKEHPEDVDTINVNLPDNFSY